MTTEVRPRRIRSVIRLLIALPLVAGSILAAPLSAQAAAPVTGPDSYSTRPSTPLTVAAPGLLANDSDGDGDLLSAAMVVNPAHGVLLLFANGGFTYTPVDGYAGPDSFTYRAEDAPGVGTTQVVSITVQNTTPSPQPDDYSTAPGVPLSISAPGVLANDVDADGDALFVDGFTGAGNGSLNVGYYGEVVYTPTAGFVGDDTFSYYAADFPLSSALAVVTIHVALPSPITTTDAYTTQVDEELIVDSPGVLGNDSDPLGLPLSAAIVTSTSHGILTLSADGKFVYKPDGSDSGTDSFTYIADDSASAPSAPTTVTITITRAAPAGGAAPAAVAVASLPLMGVDPLGGAVAAAALLLLGLLALAWRRVRLARP